MKRYILFSIILLTIISCKKEEDKDDLARVTISTAEELIRTWIFSEYPDMNPESIFPVKELTTEETWEKIQSQVFIVTGDVLTNKPLLIKNKKVTDLGIYQGLGAQEIKYIYITDLDKNNKYELSFLSTWGSGIMRTEINCYYEYLNSAIKRGDKAFYSGIQVVLKKENDEKLFIKLKTDTTIIGQIKIDTLSGNNELLLELRDGLSNEIKNNIWYDYHKKLLEL